MTQELGVTATELSIGLRSSPAGGAVAIAGPMVGFRLGGHPMMSFGVGSGVGEEVGFRVGLGMTVTGVGVGGGSSNTIESNDVSDDDNDVDGEDDEDYGEIGSIGHTDEYD